MATRTISTRLSVDGEKEFKKQMGLVNSELKTLSSEMKLATAEFKGQANSAEYLTRKDEILRKEIEQQEEKVRALKQAVADATDAYTDADTRTDGYKRSLNAAQIELIDLNDALRENERYLEEARDSADGCAKSIDEYGKHLKDAGGNADDAAKSVDELGDALEDTGDQSKGLDLKSLVGDLTDLKKMLGCGAVVAGIKEIGSAIIGVVDDTEEYRKIMGTLEVSSQQAGYSTEETAEAFEYLQGVLGDTQQAATTVANLQAIGLEQDDLMKIIEGTTGAWATYGDSIPIDGLAESINETVQAGKVTGTFADVLNWAGESEDEFNEKLAAANSSTERAQIVLDMLAKQSLPETAQQWREANGDIIAYNESQAKLDEAMGRLGEVLAPVAAGLKTVFAEGVNAAADAVSWLIDKISAAIDWIKRLTGNADEISDSAERAEASAGRRNAHTRVSGSHRGGLSSVPYDGYVAELHEGERVLTAREAQVYNALERYSGPATGGVTAKSIQTAMEQALRAPSVASAQRESINIDMTLELDGTTLARKQYTLNRAEETRRGPSLVEKR